MDRVKSTDHNEIVKISDPKVSPGGKFTSFVQRRKTTGKEYEKAIVVVDNQTEDTTRYGSEQDVNVEARWSPDGEKLAYASDRGDPTGPQIWVVPTDGGEAEQVTDVVGGVFDLAWRPDGEAISFRQFTTAHERDESYDLHCDKNTYERSDPDPRVIDRLVYRSYEGPQQGYRDRKHSHIYTTTLTGDVRRLTTGERDFANPVWRDAETLYYTVKSGDNGDDQITHNVKKHRLNHSAETVTTIETWYPWLEVASDGRVAYTTSHEEDPWCKTEIKVYDPEVEEKIPLTESMDSTARGLNTDATPAWGPDEEYIYFVIPDEGQFTLQRVHASGKSDPEKVLGTEHVIDYDISGETLAFVQSEWDYPGDLFVATYIGNDIRRKTNVNEEYLDERFVEEPEELWFTNENGNEVQGWILTPPEFDPTEEYPMIVNIHGGTHAMWTRTGSMWHEFQTLAGNGYVVFWCNPRGSNGYGTDFSVATKRDWGAAARDILHGVNFLTEKSYVDSDNMFVTGGSFGGYLTSWIIGQTDRFAGAVAQRGVYDILSFYGSTDAFKLIEWDYDMLPWNEPELSWEHSPVSNADQIDTPTLLLHSECDYRVPISNAEMLYTYLKKNDVDTRFVRYPRENHDLSRIGEPNHVIDRLQRIIRWFDGYSDHTDTPPAIERPLGAGLTNHPYHLE